MSAEKKSIITVGGRPGSGKSSASKSAATRLGFQHYSTGDLFRQLSAEKGLDLLQANHAAETDTSTDDKIDAASLKMYRDSDFFVIDSRMAWYLMPGSLKVFLDVDLTTAAKRIIDDMTPERLANEEVPSNPEEYAVQLQSRLDSEARRYESLYNVNPYDTNNYDMVINTGIFDRDMTASLVVDGFTAWRNK